MRRQYLHKGLILLGIMAMVFITGRCDGFLGGDRSTETVTSESAYLNHSDTVAYVGIETCRSCHNQIYHSFIHTGMGSSFGEADTSKSIAKIDGQRELLDPQLEMHYRPHWRGNKLLLEEYRLRQGDTTYKRQERIDYVVEVGSTPIPIL
ncbi:MAG: hypothetical protein U5L96_05535 [Owenweeksia sp.]|nr:hypothetical protein [Owenweeksia sp.]